MTASGMPGYSLGATCRLRRRADCPGCQKPGDCDTCRHFLLTEAQVCGVGHAPRFYQPTSPMDWTWGYKRRTCADYEVTR